MFPVVQHDLRETQDCSAVPLFWHTGKAKVGFSHGPATGTVL